MNKDKTRIVFFLIFVCHFTAFSHLSFAQTKTIKNTKLNFGHHRKEIKKILEKKGFKITSEDKNSILVSNNLFTHQIKINGISPIDFRCVFNAHNKLAKMIYFFESQLHHDEALKILESLYKVALKNPQPRDRYLIRDNPYPEMFDYLIDVLDKHFATSELQGPTVFVIPQTILNGQLMHRAFFQCV